MGEYFLWVNLTKKEYITPHELDGGAKLCEWCAGNARIMPFVLANRWAGDRTVMVGDESQTDFYRKVVQGEFKNITWQVAEEFNNFIENDDLKVHYMSTADFLYKLGKNNNALDLL